MRKIYPIGILMLVVLLVGCAPQVEPTMYVADEVLSKEKIQVDLYLPQEVQTQMYEPKEGIYLGAYVEKNIDLEGMMRQYEEIIGKEQAFRVFQYNEPGDITNLNLLQCIAAKQTPYIKILADEAQDLMSIYQFLGDMHTLYNIPVFIELFPVNKQMDNPVAYREYYTSAYKLIKRYNDDVTIVWSTDLESVYDSKLYFPGSEYVDWVGLNVFLPKYKDQEVYDPNFKQYIDFWYKTYQKDKPMLLSTLAVSHFSRIDHTYTLQDAKNKLSYFYDEMLQDYPRIKAILQADIDMYQITASGKDDYRLTSQQGLIEHMSTLLEGGSYRDEVNRENQERQIIPMLYTLEAYRIEGDVYATAEQLKSLYDEKSLKKVPAIMDASQIKYYSLEWLAEERDGYISVDREFAANN